MAKIKFHGESLPLNVAIIVKIGFMNILKKGYEGTFYFDRR